MRRSPRALLAALVVTLAVALEPGSLAGAATPAAAHSSRRVGDDQSVIAAAIELSGASWADGAADLVVLARDDVFADALAGAALAGTSGPVLFATGGSDATLTPAVRAEIARVLPPPGGCGAPGRVVILGGTAAVSSAVEDELAASGDCVERLAGADRVETAVLIAERAQDPSTVLLARADTWPDAAAASAYAAASGHPIVLTFPDALSPSVATFLDAVEPGRVVLLGGTGALAPAVEHEVAAHAPTSRVQGATRDATAAAIATELWPPLAPTGVTLVEGWSTTSWAYAIAGGVVAAVEGAPELLVHAAALTDADVRHLDDAADTFTLTVGPRSMVSDAVVRTVETSRGWHLLAPPGAAPLRYRDAIATDVTKTADITYGSAVNRSGTTVVLKLDVYEAKDDDTVGRPAIVWIHGGSFCCGSKTSPEIVDEATTFAKKGYVTVSIDYRLEPQGCSAASPTGECVDAIREATADAKTAVRFLRAKASTFGIDPTRIAAAGSSAGAITALDVGYDSNEEPASAVRAVVSLSGANVLGYITAGDAPALLLHGTSDHTVPYAWAASTVSQGRAAGVITLLTAWEGAGHTPYVQFHDQILEETRNFLWWMLDLDAVQP